MKKILTMALLALTTSAFSQQYLTREATLSFDAGSPLEDIYAVSESASAVYDAATGKLGVQVLMTSFQFKRALMQEHFNENYAESEKFPKAQFTGVFQGGEAIGLPWNLNTYSSVLQELLTGSSLADVVLNE